MRVTYSSVTRNASKHSAPAIPHIVRPTAMRSTGDELRSSTSAARSPAWPSHSGIARVARALARAARESRRSARGSSAEERVRAELDRDRPLGRVAQREAAHAERRRLLLHAARVGEDERAPRPRGRGSRDSRAVRRRARGRLEQVRVSRSFEPRGRARMHREDERASLSASSASARRRSHAGARGRRRATADAASRARSSPGSSPKLAPRRGSRARLEDA